MANKKYAVKNKMDMADFFVKAGKSTTLMGIVIRQGCKHYSPSFALPF
jgi:hypothetical protein